MMTIKAANTAIVAMDFQAAILQSLGDTHTLLGKVAGAVAATRAAGGRVALVRVAFTDAELASFPPHSAMGHRMVAIRDKMAVDAPTAALVPEIEVQDADIAVRKIRVGPFRTTDLDRQLRDDGIDTIVFAGIHTSGCVLTGVREAHDLDYRIIVLSDACADPDAEVHSFLMEKILPRQAQVLTTAEYLDALK